MSDQVIVWAVHQDVRPLLIGLAGGWLIVLVGTLRWGWRFAAMALPAGFLIPAAQFVLRPDLWRAMIDPEICAWNAVYWIVPAVLVAVGALWVRRGTSV
jgi:hypothetical protein